MQREPRSRFYDGVLYGTLLDPLLAGLHERLAAEIPDGARVIDAGCGTGDLLFRLAPRIREGLGVELSPAHVRYAEKREQRERTGKLTFRVADASRLEDLPDHAFDLATIALAVHEMPTEARAAVLKELGRVAKEVLVLDWATPMPWNAAGLRNRALEMGAGPEHFRSYLDFQRRGGLDPILREAGLRALSDRPIDAASLRIVRATAQPPVSSRS
jgi:SAM-dependent methyltransferase